MIRNYLLLMLVAVATLSCRKDGENGRGIYIVSADRMIDLTSNGWKNAEAKLKNRTGYEYEPASANTSALLKAVINLPAMDDSNRTVIGKMLLNVAPDDRVFHASFSTEPLSKDVAFAMMLNYHNKSLQTFTGVSSSIGTLEENRMGSNTSVDVILSRVTNRQDADQLGIIYYAAQGAYTMVLFRQPDGRYIFSFRGSR